MSAEACIINCQYYNHCRISVETLIDTGDEQSVRRARAAAALSVSVAHCFAEPNDILHCAILQRQDELVIIEKSIPRQQL